MSPEQATGDRAIDGRTDIYSLGALTYEMLTGDAPHTGSTSQAIIARLLTERPRSIRTARSAVPEHVEAAVERALEKLPADRWATAKEFAEALTGARAVSRATSATSPAAAPSTARKKPNARELIAWGLAAAGIVGTVALATRNDPPAETGSPVLFEVTLPDGMDLTPVGNQATIALDAEGTTLVFQGRDSLGSDPALFIRRLDDQAIVKIRGTDNARSPILSPDGNEVLFMPPVPGTGRGGVATGMRVALRGGTPRTFIDSTSSNGQVSWIDDKLIALALQDALWTMPAAGGPRSLLARPDSVRQHLRYGFPALLPGGEAAVISIWKSRNTVDAIELGIVDIPAGTVTELGISGTNPRYSPTGHLLFVTSDGVLMAAPFDTRSRRVSAPSFPIAEGVRVGTGGAAAIAVARNGTIAWLGGGAERGTSRIVAVSRAGVERPIPLPTGFYLYPRVSPDGKQIAMTVADRAGAFAASDIWRVDLTSNALLRVTTDSQSYRANWLPDGERIAYIKVTEGTSGLGVPMVRPLYRSGEATPMTALVAGVFNISVGPTPGYSALAIDTSATSNTARDDIWLVHSDSLDKPRPFLTQPYRELSPRVSPDGRWLAYVSERTGRQEVYVQPIPRGGDEVPISLDGGFDPLWSRSGKELFYRTQTHLMAATVSPGARLQVQRRDTLFTAGQRFRTGSPSFDVLPGDQEFIMLRSGELGNVFPLMVMTNWHKGRSGGLPGR
jgi:serine/threonine-protein kinase